MREAPFVPVIPAGGSGTRLWPLSRRDRPKFLLDLTGTGRSLLQQTVQRLAPSADAAPIVVTGAAHAAQAEDQVGRQARVLAEPEPRDSMPAIALAAAIVERERPDAVIGSFAADHLITDTDGLARSIATARAAAELGYLVTIGIEPTHPATGFGYVERAPAAEQTPAGPSTAAALRATGAEPVARFVEKPDQRRAGEFLASGRFVWNAGMFVARAGILLDALAEQLPPLAAGARRIAAAGDAADTERVLTEVWPTLTRIAIDHALAEPLAAAGRVAVVPAAFDWDDVGDFATLSRQLRSPARAPGVAAVTDDGNDVRVLGGADVMATGSRATVYGSAHRHVALVGLEGISVVDTDETLLVLADDHAQRLSDLVGRLAQEGRADLR